MIDTTAGLLPVAPSNGRLQPIAGSAVRLVGGFWGARQDLNATTFLDHCDRWISGMGWIDNFTLASEGRSAQQRRGKLFTDADVYKFVEALAWEAARTGDPEREARVAEIGAAIASAQEEDGYLNTYFGHRGPDARYTDLAHGHELYCAGHLFQAAVARLRTNGEDDLTRAAVRLADRICEDFGPDGRPEICGHPEIELGLMELYRATGHRRYLEQARLFIERRGHQTLAPHAIGHEYYQDDVPVRDATVLRGHAVRALYYAASVVDLAVETGDVDLLDAVIRQWDATIARRTYITGGMGSRHLGESFGNDYELPPDRAYAEMCGAVAAIHLAWRLLLATGETRFADTIERMLYNMIATFHNIDGDRFFYANPLHQRQPGIEVPDGEVPFRKDTLRAPWFWVSCCPTNIARLLATMSAYVATHDGRGIQLHQHVAGDVSANLGDKGAVRLAVRTEYPVRSDVEIEVLETSGAPWTLSLRVPPWADADARVDVADTSRQVQPGMVDIDRVWQVGDVVRLALPMEARMVRPDPRIDAIRGTVAIERGPVVYCLEDPDLPGDLTVNDVEIDPDEPLIDAPGPSGLGPDIVAVRARGRLVRLPDPMPWPYAPDRRSTAGDALDLTLIPYHRWSNRGPSTMRVWIPAAAGQGS
jgi:DUF1680 family protein